VPVPQLVVTCEGTFFFASPTHNRQLLNRPRLVFQRHVSVEIHGYGILILPSTTNARSFAVKKLPNLPQHIWIIRKQVASDGFVFFGLEGSLADLVLNP